MAGMVEIVVGAVGAVLMIFIFLEVLKVFTWNSSQTNISGSAIALLNIVDLVIAAMVLVGVVALAFRAR